MLKVRKQFRMLMQSMKLYYTWIKEQWGRAALNRAPRPFVGVLRQALLVLLSENLDSLQHELDNVLRLMDSKALKARGTLLSAL